MVELRVIKHTWSPYILISIIVSFEEFRAIFSSGSIKKQPDQWQPTVTTTFGELSVILESEKP